MFKTLQNSETKSIDENFKWERGKFSFIYKATEISKSAVAYILKEENVNLNKYESKFLSLRDIITFLVIISGKAL